MAVCLIDLNTGVDEAGSRGEHVAVREPYALWVTGSAARVHKVCKGSKQWWRREGEVFMYVSVEAPGRTQTNTRALTHARATDMRALSHRTDEPERWCRRAP